MVGTQSSSQTSLAQEPFRYMPFSTDESAKEIRLLTLHPPQCSSEEISCTLSNVALSGQPVYEALSYCWGDENTKLPIQCNGVQVMVTENLFSVLCTLRKPNGQNARVLWVDALCIDQSNAEEKEKQLVIMAQIYKAAQRVLIWLGSASEESPGTMALLRELGQVETSSNSYQFQDHQRVLLDNMKARGLSSMDPRWSALVMMLDRAWFNRAWVVQELAVAQEVIVLCGDDECFWSDLQTAVYKSGLLMIPAILNNKSLYQQVVQMHSMRQSIQTGKTQHLFQLLLEARQREAKLPEDKIFSLCGLASDVGSDALDVQPNCHIEPATLYCQLALKMLRRDRFLDVLSVPRVSKPSKVGNLPSWVPDWSVGDATWSLRRPIIPGGDPWRFEATPANGNKSFAQIDERTIAISGQIVDEVANIGDVFGGDPLEEKDPGKDSDITSIISRRVAIAMNMQRTLNGWEDIAAVYSEGKYPPTGEDVLDAYWQTIAAGQVNDHEAAKQDFLIWDRKVRSVFMHVPPADSGWLPTTWGWLKVITKMALSMLGDLLFSSSLGSRTSQRWAFPGRMMISSNRRFFKTKTGYIGVGPSLLREGDRIVRAEGGMVPLVLRAVNETQTEWELVGDAYVHGIMHGEMFDVTKCERLLIV